MAGISKTTDRIESIH